MQDKQPNTASPSHEVAAFYEGTADAYARMMDAEIDLPVYDAVLSALARRLAGVPGPLVDTSCGSGHMLERYRRRHDAERALVGVDLSPSMVALASARLGDDATVIEGDMRRLASVSDGAAAGVISFFAIHHLGPEDAAAAFREWRRVLGPSGRLTLAAWEGTGAIDYGDHGDVVAFRYTADSLQSWARDAGFDRVACTVTPIDGFDMDAVYLDADIG